MSAGHDPFLERLGDELERAIELRIQGQSKPRHWLPRRRVIRLAVLGFATIVALSGTALAAGGMLGEIGLGNGVHAQRVQSEPTWDAITGVFVSRRGGYIYHVIGGSALALSCGATDTLPTNDIYVRASKPLGVSELKSLFASQLARPPIPATTLTAKLKAKLRSHRRKPGSRTSEVLPSGVLSVSNGCPRGRDSALPALPHAGEAGFTQHLAR